VVLAGVDHIVVGLAFSAHLYITHYSLNAFLPYYSINYVGIKYADA
jgi:hypothetical protein